MGWLIGEMGNAFREIMVHHTKLIINCSVSHTALQSTLNHLKTSSRKGKFLSVKLQRIPYFQFRELSSEQSCLNGPAAFVSSHSKKIFYANVDVTIIRYTINNRISF